jgi:hypothetical protein
MALRDRWAGFREGRGPRHAYRPGLCSGNVVLIAVGVLLVLPAPSRAAYSLETGPPAVQASADADPQTQAVISQMDQQIYGATRLRAFTCFDRIDSPWTGHVEAVPPGDQAALRDPFFLTMPAVGHAFTWGSPVQIQDAAGGQTARSFDGSRTGDRSVVFHTRWFQTYPGDVAPYGFFLISTTVDATYTATIHASAPVTSPGDDANVMQSTPVQSCVLPPRFQPDEKRHYKEIGRSAKRVAIFAGLAGTLCGAFAPGLSKFTCLLFPVAAAYMTWTGLDMDELADDPPDPNFRSTYHPRRQRASRIRSGRRVDPAVRRAFDRLLGAYDRSTRARSGVVVSVNRAQGAYVSHDPANAPWERTQMLAAAHYARLLATDAERVRSDQAAASRAIRAAGIRFTIPSSALRRERRRIAGAGLPGDVKEAARAMGAPAAVLSELRRAIATVAPAQLRPVSLQSVLADPAADNGQERLARTMRAFAARVDANPMAAAATVARRRAAR